MNTKVNQVLEGYVALSEQEQRQFVFDLADHILALPLGNEVHSSGDNIENPSPAGEHLGPQTTGLDPSQVH